MSHVNRTRVTIREVAARAGVSIQTVSRVINDRPDVSGDTRARVQAAIAELRYHPNGIARSLSTNTSDALGVIASGFHHYGPSQLLTGIERQATELGWHLVLLNIDPTKANEYDRVAAALLSQRLPGVIWAYPELTGERERAFHRQVAPHTHIVFLSMPPQPGSAVISVDNRAGARMAVEHLIARGRRCIGLVTGPQALWSARQRRLGWHDALTAAGVPACDAQIASGDWSAASGEAGLARLLAHSPDLDAVFASNDQMALGVLRHAHRLGRRVPDDLGVVGFDDTPESAFFTPALTTVHHDLIELGQLAVRELSRAVRARQAGARAVAPASLMLQPALVVRESA